MGPYAPTHITSGQAHETAQVVFSGNYAAVVGVALCFCLLVAWIKTQLDTPVAEEE